MFDKAFFNCMLPELFKWHQNMSFDAYLLDDNKANTKDDVMCARRERILNVHFVEVTSFSICQFVCTPTDHTLDTWCIPVGLGKMEFNKKSFEFTCFTSIVCGWPFLTSDMKRLMQLSFFCNLCIHGLKIPFFFFPFYTHRLCEDQLFFQ